MNKLLQLFIVSVLMLFISSCGANDKKSKPPRIAKAVIEPTQGNIVSGIVWFTEARDGVRVLADVYGLTPGKHGFHVHEHGDCSASDGLSAGGHFNPTNQKHGGPDSLERHVGDLGNLEADQNGHAHFEWIDNVLQLTGEHSIIGKSMIVHQGEDDLVSQPTGNAGARLGCGKILLVKPQN